VADDRLGVDLGQRDVARKEVTAMDGSTASLIAIPIVVTLSLVAWLLAVAYAAAHPQWKHGTASAGADHLSQADALVRATESRPNHLALADAGEDVTPDKHAKLAA
jgi:hypothetical protein